MDTTAKSDRWGLAFLAAACLLMLLSLSNQSLWIDEGDTAIYALQPTLTAWWHHLVGDINADCQMPLTMLIAWLGAQAVGSGELMLRLPNLLWGFGTLFALYLLGKKHRIPWLPLLMAVQPYFWFYTDQARPYAAQLCAGAWLLYGFHELWAGKARNSDWVTPVGLGMLFLCHLTILAVVPAFAFAAVTLLLCFSEKWLPSRKDLVRLLAWLSLNVPIACYYYFFTFLKGEKRTPLWEMDIKNVGFMLYELLGLSGLGPPVREIRRAAQDHDLGSLILPWLQGWVLIAVFAALCLVIVFLGVRRDFKRKMALAWPYLAVAGLSVVLLFSGGFFLKKAFWARHLAPVFPLVVFAIALVLRDTWKTFPKWTGGAALGLVVLWLFSSLNLRFNPLHRNDDYRSTASLARAELNQGGVVWWSGSWHCAAYYGLPVDLAGNFNDARFVEVNNVGPEKTRQAPKADLIVVTRPQIYDDRGAVRAFIKESGYRAEQGPNGFVLFRP